ncbi:MAG: polysaccharide pyruvyl transferase family protein [Steroidobacteraceae bacterium]
MNSGPRIALLGPFVSRNLGDTATQLEVIRNIRLRRPDVQIVGVCSEPEDTRRTHGIEAFPFAWERAPDGREVLARVPWVLRGPLQRLRHFVRVLRFAGRLDLLVISGGGQLDELWGGAWRQPYLLWLWTLAARLRGVPVVAFGVGWDHLDSTRGRAFGTAAMRRAARRFVRDQGTFALLRAAGLAEPMIVGPDAAFGLPPPETADRVPVTSPRRFVVVSPISLGAVPPKQRDSHDRFIDELARACRQWMEAGYDVRFVCSQPAMDGPWVEKITAQLPAANGEARWTMCREQGVDAYLRNVRGATFVLSARLHGLILAIAAGCPVVGIHYSRKIAQVLDDCGLARYAIEPDGADAAGLVAVAGELVRNEDALRRQIAAYCETARTQLAGEYKALLEYLPAKA